MASNAGGFGAFSPNMFGAFGAPPAPEPASFDALSRQYWSQWGDWMRSAAAPMQAPPSAGMDDALAWWMRLAQGAQPKPQMHDALHRWDTQGRDWMTRMQQVASQFAGRDASAAEITQAWRSAMGMAFDPTQLGFGGVDVQQLMRQATPFLTQLQGSARDMTQMPAFGFAREHQQRWQQLTQSQLDFHTDSAPYFELMSQALQDAFVRFEARLGERSEPGKQLTSARALFDLWIDAAEEAYADVAISPAFRDAYGSHVNAQMRLKAAMQQEVEQATGAVGMPTRTEIDSAHRKIVQLERDVRRLRDALEAQREERALDAAARPAKTTPAQTTARNAVPRAAAPAPAKSVTKGTRHSAPTPASKVAAPARAAAKPAVKKAIAAKTVARKASAAKPAAAIRKGKR